MALSLLAGAATPLAPTASADPPGIPFMTPRTDVNRGSSSEFGQNAAGFGSPGSFNGSSAGQGGVSFGAIPLGIGFENFGPQVIGSSEHTSVQPSGNLPPTIIPDTTVRNVPEPGSIVALLTMIGLLMLVRRRQGSEG